MARFIEQIFFPKGNPAERVFNRRKDETVAYWRPKRGIEVAPFFALHGASTSAIPLRRAYRNRRIESLVLEVESTDLQSDTERKQTWLIPSPNDDQLEATGVDGEVPEDAISHGDDVTRARLRVTNEVVPEPRVLVIRVSERNSCFCPCCSHQYPGSSL